MDLLVYKDGDPVEVDPAWLSEKIGKRVLSAKVTTAEKMGGMSGEQYLPYTLLKDSISNLCFVSRLLCLFFYPSP